MLVLLLALSQTTAQSRPRSSMVAFVDWLGANRVDLSDPAWSVAYADNAGWTVRLRRPVKMGEAALSVPSELVLDGDSCRARGGAAARTVLEALREDPALPPWDAVGEHNFFGEGRSIATLALCLAVDAADGASFWAPYYAILPEVGAGYGMTVLDWSAEEDRLARRHHTTGPLWTAAPPELGDVAAGAYAAGLLHSSARAKLKALLARPGAAGRFPGLRAAMERLTPERVGWALGAVMTRSFTAPSGPAMVPLIDLANHDGATGSPIRFPPRSAHDRSRQDDPLLQTIVCAARDMVAGEEFNTLYHHAAPLATLGPYGFVQRAPFYPHVVLIVRFSLGVDEQQSPKASARHALMFATLSRMGDNCSGADSLLFTPPQLGNITRDSDLFGAAAFARLTAGGAQQVLGKLTPFYEMRATSASQVLKNSTFRPPGFKPDFRQLTVPPSDFGHAPLPDAPCLMELHLRLTAEQIVSPAALTAWRMMQLTDEDVAKATEEDARRMLRLRPLSAQNEQRAFRGLRAHCAAMVKATMGEVEEQQLRAGGKIREPMLAALAQEHAAWSNALRVVEARWLAMLADGDSSEGALLPDRPGPAAAPLDVAAVERAVAAHDRVELQRHLALARESVAGGDAKQGAVEYLTALRFDAASEEAVSGLRAL